MAKHHRNPPGYHFAGQMGQNVRRGVSAPPEKASFCAARQRHFSGQDVHHSCGEEALKGWHTNLVQKRHERGTACVRTPYMFM